MTNQTEQKSSEPRGSNWVIRILAIWAIEVVALVLMTFLFSGFAVENWGTAIIAVAVIAILNAVLWPILIRFTLPLTVLTFGLLTLVLNGLMVWLAGQIVPGMTVNSLWTAIGVALGLTAVNTFFSTLLAIDDDDSYYRNVLQKRIKQELNPEETDVPGVFFLEIDGLSKSVLLRAIRNGHAPTMARWLDEGNHRLVEWECDWSSQTGASQAGILLGSNFDMPAFRWYEKENKRILVSNHPEDTAELEKRHSKGDGLLADDGVSLGNMFSGGATHTMITFSALNDRSRFKPKNFQFYFIDPYNFSRGLLLFVWDIYLEWRAAWRQRRRDVRPRLDHRGGIYPLLRGGTTIWLRELVVHTLIGAMYAGVRSAYVTFVGYDEVAHHSGVEREDALDVLFKLDQQFARLESAAKRAPRPYKFVVLSDHGQSQGATFKQRYDMTLEDLTQQLLSADVKVRKLIQATEDWGNINVALTDAAQEDTRAGRILQRAVKSHTQIGNVVLGPKEKKARAEKAATDEEAGVIVLASGNLGLIYFTHWEKRMTLEQIDEAFPAMIPGLTHHPGIGFVMVRSAEHGPLAIGADGVYYLDDDRVEGKNPLAHFGPNAAQHLRRSDTFPHVADIMVNSFYNPETEEVAAFEELVGNHGGLGGDQSKPFILYPSTWELPPEKIIGADHVYKVLKGWLALANG